jgi:hypothetical protein
MTTRKGRNANVLCADLQNVADRHRWQDSMISLVGDWRVALWWAGSVAQVGENDNNEGEERRRVVCPVVLEDLLMTGLQKVTD